MNDTVAIISLSWDEFGRVEHELRSFIPADDYQESDALGLSVPLIVASQCGVLAPRYSLDLCRCTLEYLSGVELKPEVIQFPLSSAKIELIRKESTIVPIFHPSVLEGGTMEPEEAVRRLLTNYIFRVDSDLIPEIRHYLRATLMAVVSYYLSEALEQELDAPDFSLDVPPPRLHELMLGFTFSIFPQWQGGPSIQPKRFKKNLGEIRGQYESVISRIY